MGLRFVPLAVVASVLLLAGCAPAPGMPEPMTQAEAQRQLDDHNRTQWDSMFPGEPMPEVEPVGYLQPGASWTEITDCLRDANLEGMAFNDDGTSSRSITSTPERTHTLLVAQFLCQLKYPIDVSDPAKAGFLTDEELTWITDYNRERLVPCLEQLGYSAGMGADGVSAYPTYIRPLPVSVREWALIDFHCPPSPIGPGFHPTAG